MPEEVILSVDMDWFCREEPDWDWGHSETNPMLMSDVIWLTRYQSLDLYAETDLDKYADLWPHMLLAKLRSFGFMIDKNTSIGASWTHADALAFFKETSWRGRKLFNFDAHHDLFNRDEKVDCGNWVWHVMRSGYVREACWVLPKWLSPMAYDKPVATVKRAGLADLFQSPRVHVESIFIAQSPAWVPPHFDKHFEHLCRQLMNLCKKPMWGGKFVQRTAPSREEAQEMLKQWEKLRKEMMA